jgi:hypothetical protein
MYPAASRAREGAGVGVALPVPPSKMPEVAFVPRATAAAWLQQSQGEAEETRRKSLAAVQSVTAWAEAAVQKTTDHYTAFIQVENGDHSSGTCMMHVTGASMCGLCPVLPPGDG